MSVDGTIVVDEEMGTRSSSLQGANFTISLPQTARTAFQGNEAPQGGGGACFYDTAPPDNMESYREESQNSAMYGVFSATPAQTLSLASASRTPRAIPGNSMELPITVECCMIISAQ